MRGACFLAVASGIAAQSLPGAVAPLLSKFRAVLDSADGDDQRAVEALTQDAAAELAEGVARDRAARLLADAASTAAVAASFVRKLLACRQDGSIELFSEGQGR